MAQMTLKSCVGIINDDKHRYSTHRLQKLGCITRIKLDLNFNCLKSKGFNKSKIFKAFAAGHSTQKLWSEQYYCNVQHFENCQVLET